MRLIYFGNNRLGWQVLHWLREQGEQIVGLVLHPETQRKYGQALLEAAGLPPEQVFDGSRLREPAVLERIAALRPDLGLSVLFGCILRPPLLALMPGGCLNLHLSLLPWNRGAYPNVWSIIDGTPAGVTIHHIDAGVDTGDVVAQAEVRVEPIDTGASLYQKLEEAGYELFCAQWPRIRSGSAPRVTQSAGAGTCHRVAHTAAIDEIDLAREYPAGKLLDVLRARTFPPYRGAYFVAGGRRVYVQVSLEYDTDDAAETERRAD